MLQFNTTAGKMARKIPNWRTSWKYEPIKIKTVASKQDHTVYV
jgi:hypothetical protein